MDDWANFMGFVIKINKTVLLSAHNRWKEKKKVRMISIAPFYAERRQMNKLCVKCETLSCLNSNISDKMGGASAGNVDNAALRSDTKETDRHRI